MAVRSIPTVSVAILFDSPNFETANVCKAEASIPNDEGFINKEVEKTINELAIDCVPALRHIKESKMTLQVVFSKKNISIVSSNKEVKQIFATNVQKYLEILKAALPKKIQPLDLVLFRGNVMGQTTGNLRYPHLLQYFFEHLENERKSEETKICIIGPGVYMNEVQGKQIPSSPQFVEIFSLFPKAQFVLLDNENVAVMKKYCEQGIGANKSRIIIYDPLMIRFRTMPASDILAPSSYQPLLREMGEFFKNHAFNKQPNEIDEMLIQHLRQLTKFYVKVPEKVRVEQFDINSDPVTEKFDIIVATMSIGNVLMDCKDNDHIVSTMVKFLEALNPNGKLYIEEPFIKSIEACMDQIESKVGRKISTRKIPYSSFAPEAEDRDAIAPMISSFTIDHVKTNNPIAKVSTASIIEISFLG